MRESERERDRKRERESDLLIVCFSCWKELFDDCLSYLMTVSVI